MISYDDLLPGVRFMAARQTKIGPNQGTPQNNASLQAKTVRNRATYVGQVDNLPPIVNRPIAGGPIAHRPAGYHPAPQKYRAWL